jgi:hypothetical protein
MHRQSINCYSAIIPVMLSLMAFLLVIAAVSTGLGKAGQDEGVAAHLFQFLIVAQIPFILAFLATANWRRWTRVTGQLALQACAVTLAFAPVAYFNL